MDSLWMLFFLYIIGQVSFSWCLITCHEISCYDVVSFESEL
jgi:hypothetical protein